MSIIEELERLKTQVESGLDDVLDAQVQMLLGWVSIRSSWLFAQLREHHPILAVHTLVLASKYDDVVEVLEQPVVFSLRRYEEKLERTAGRVLLELPVGAERDHDLAALRVGIRPEDLATLRRLTAESVEALLQPALASGELEVVGLLHRVPVQVLGRYFGFPGPDEASLMRWGRAIFEDIFVNVRNDADAAEAAIQAGIDFRAYLDQHIAERHAALAGGAPAQDDVLGRWIAAQTDPAVTARFDDVAIRNNFIGMTMGGIDTIYTAMVHVLAELLQRPEALQGARQAVEDGDDARLDGYIREALRFRPEDPFLYRYCEEAYTLAQGTPRETHIAPGSLVILANASAMHDADRVPDPETFRPDRPAAEYLHFGRGLHACYGQHIAFTQVREVTRRMLRLPGLRAAGDVAYEGVYPKSFVVRFDPVAPGA
jgi:cytochrome P450